LIGITENRLLDIIKKNGTICFALIDSEGKSQKQTINTIKKAEEIGINGILIGGSTATDQKELDNITRTIKSITSLPVILFPGNITGISHNADAILFSSLLNSNNPYFIIEAQMLSAPIVKKYNLEAIPMGYIIIGNGGTTGYIGNARVIPPEKGDIAAMYALAAQYMGMRVIYLEAGSGVTEPISSGLINKVRKIFNGILIVGGGIRSAEKAIEISNAGADIIVIGTLIEEKGFEIKLKEIINILKQK
jgi:phosphoglycerol geranylgeranyltransferase|tara:strand:- start:3891 stop:4637 length:747 start_codon:yes stop_codon:yes gene_type:complete